MWYLPFWILCAISILLAGVAFVIRKPKFEDIQILVMVIAITMSCDMLFCKQFKMYYYVVQENKGWYSFWANFVVIPVLSIVFIKFLPKSIKGVAAYIAVWSVLATLFEIYIAAPFGILHYLKWRVFPYSTIGYVLVFAMVYLYYRVLLKYKRRLY